MILLLGGHAAALEQWLAENERKPRRDKQKKGKEKMKERGSVTISHDVFLKMMRNEN